MPVIKTLPSCRIKIHFKDHKPPHVHVVTNEAVAKLLISDGTRIAGEVPPKTIRAARKWLAANRDEAMLKWQEYAEAK